MDTKIDHTQENPLHPSAAQESQLRRDLRRLHAQSPNADEAWRRLSTRLAMQKEEAGIAPFAGEAAGKTTKRIFAGHRTRLYYGGAAAALVVLCLLVGWWLFPSGQAMLQEPVLVYSHNSRDSQSVTLCNASGTCYLLQGDSETTGILREEGILAGETNAVFLAKEKKTQATENTMSLYVPHGKIYSATLCDGTQVWLNSDSRLEFPESFACDERRVVLKGEAYFKVAQNAECPFRVVTDNFSTLVLGTEFDVNVYNPELQYVALAQGVVALSTDSQRSHIAMHAGQCAFVDNSGNTRVQEVDVYSLIQWRENLLYFNDVDLRTVMEALGRWYNVDVYFANPRRLSTLLHFVCDRTASLQEAINNLNALKVAKIELKEGKITVR